ncbi:TPA: hypothetical protein ACGPGC_003383 [Enterobacter hormaechei]|uniref:hypothetical protein n=1 Tax=Enterobacter cloacae TaxID=550 RepID=UPI0024699A5B|nr:hypothetical protein [Enterobacter cloacae]WGL80942.1 hypothetical protein QFB83_15940 [Enterobacter cloacae]
MAKPPSKAQLKAQTKADARNKQATEKAKEQLRKFAIKQGDDYMKRVGKASRQSAIILRETLADKIDRPIAFTQNNSTFYTFTKISETKVVHKIGIKDIQDRYLSSLFKDRIKPTDKFIPINRSYIDGHGNIKGLNKNTQSGRYVSVSKNQNRFNEILIDKNQKDRTKRLIAIKHAPTKRKPVFDWEQIETELITNIQKAAKK